MLSENVFITFCDKYMWIVPAWGRSDHSGYSACLYLLKQSKDLMMFWHILRLLNSWFRGRKIILGSHIRITSFFPPLSSNDVNLISHIPVTMYFLGMQLSLPFLFSLPWDSPWLGAPYTDSRVCLLWWVNRGLDRKGWKSLCQIARWSEWHSWNQWAGF